METPTISKKQEKKTLSGKKVKKEAIKNVLGKPFVNYWPLISPKDYDLMKETLERFLPRLKHDKVKVPYKTIKTIPKEERKQFREKYAKVDPIKINETDRNNIVFGVNDVAKLIEMGEAGSVLVAEDIQPRLFIQHVIDEAVLYSVAILVVRNLRQILKNNCGISGAVIAFKKAAESSANLGFIHQIICKIYENYAVPETHINYNRRLEVSHIMISDSENDTSVVVLSDSEEDTKTTNYHLKRESDKKRVFIPEKSKIETMTVDSNDFISFGENSTFNTKRVTNYRHLVVKRLKGDKNRNKRKMEMFKKK